MNYSLLYQGSVKNLFENKNDILFEYTNRYSLFDWGEMPDHLDKKGEALCLMGSLFFAELSKHNIPHHFISLSNAEGELVDWEPTRFMKVKKVSVTRPKKNENTYDYSFYQTHPQEGLVPLEVIFRFGAGSGSPLHKRVNQNPSLFQQWGLNQLEEDKLWDLPLIDFSTKLEPGDRYLTHEEAKKLAGLSSVEFSSLVDLTTKVAIIIRNLSQEMGLELWDGKIEWAFTPGEERSFMLVDSIGLDELRLVHEGKSISKEFLREYYRSTSWFNEMNRAKELSLKNGEDFRKLCHEMPPKLDASIKDEASSLYLSFTNDLAHKVLGRVIFDEKYNLKNWRKA